MARNHNTKHTRRGRSNYPQRLAKRGMTNVDVRMESLDVLRKRALRRDGSVRGLGIDEFDIDREEAMSA